MVPRTLQASMCDEQFMSTGGEIALSGNSKKENIKKEQKGVKQKNKGVKE